MFYAAVDHVIPCSEGGQKPCCELQAGLNGFWDGDRRTCRKELSSMAAIARPGKYRVCDD